MVRLARLVGVLAAVGGCMALAACGSDTPSSDGSAAQATGGGSQSKIEKVTYVNPLPVYPGFNEIARCFEAEAKRLGYDPEILGTRGSAVDNQAAIDLMEQAVAHGTDALLGVFVDTALFTPVVRKAREQGVYVGGIATGDESTGQQFRVGTVWETAGAAVADGVGPQHPDAHVAFLSNSPTSTPQADAIRGFKAEAAKRFPDMQMIATTYDNGDPTKDVDVVGNMLAAHPDVDVLFLVPGNTAGGLTAVRERGLVGKVTVVSGDLTPDHRAAIKSGEMYGVTVQNWCGIGRQGIDLFHQLETGAQIPFETDTGVRFVTKDDMPATGV